MVQEVKIIAHQSLFDIAVQSCGKIDHLVDIAVLNDLSLTDELSVASVLTPIVNNELQIYFKNNTILVATAHSNQVDYGFPLSL